MITVNKEVQQKRYCTSLLLLLQLCNVIVVYSCVVVLLPILCLLIHTNISLKVNKCNFLSPFSKTFQVISLSSVVSNYQASG